LCFSLRQDAQTRYGGQTSRGPHIFFFIKICMMPQSVGCYSLHKFVDIILGIIYKNDMIYHFILEISETMGYS
jgi:hypothetical protein